MTVRAKAGDRGGFVAGGAKQAASRLALGISIDGAEDIKSAALLVARSLIPGGQ
jgi:hypothetical protein